MTAEAIMVWAFVLLAGTLIVIYLMAGRRKLNPPPWRPGGIENRSDSTYPIPIEGRHRQ